MAVAVRSQETSSSAFSLFRARQVLSAGFLVAMTTTPSMWPVGTEFRPEASRTRPSHSCGLWQEDREGLDRSSQQWESRLAAGSEDVRASR